MLNRAPKCCIMINTTRQNPTEPARRCSVNAEEKAFVEKLYIETAQLLLGYARRLLGDRDLAEEAVQDAFRVACSRADVLMASANPQGWMMNTVKNVSRNIVRSRARSAAFLARMQLGEKAYSEPQDIRDPDLLYENLKDDDDYLLLKRLSEPGATIASVAAELGIGVSACSKRIQRARKRLRKFF